jgi:hypothetical protein
MHIDRSVPDAPSTLRRVRLWTEFVLLYGIVPVVVAVLLQPVRAQTFLARFGIRADLDTGLPGGLFVFPVLLASFVVLTVVLRMDPTFENRRLWNRDGFKRDLKRILVVFALCAPTILLAAWMMEHVFGLLPKGGFLRLPREIPILLLMITLLYPWVSAYPQEVTHRAFFFHRYKPILGEGRLAFVLNVIAFSWLHAPMWNWVALAMTIPAGILFAWTYLRSKSALASGFEHAIYGIWTFATGLGWFVFTGSGNVT